MKITNYHKDNPLALKLIGYIFLCSLFITLVAVCWLLVQSYQQGRDDLELRLQQSVQTAIPGIVRSIWNYDDDQLAIQMEGLLLLEDVVEVTVVVKGINDQYDIKTVKQDTKPRTARILTRQYPLTFKQRGSEVQQELGTMQVVVSLEALYQYLWDQALFIFVFNILKTILISLVILWLLQRLLTGHLANLAAFTQKLSAENLSVPFVLKRRKPVSDDELDRVVSSINQMRDRLQEDMTQQEIMYRSLLEQQKARQQVEQERQLISAKYESKSEFLATMSHEVRTPISSVMSAAELVMQTPLNHEQAYYLGVIQNASQSLLNLVNDVLDFSKMEAGSLVLNEESFDFYHLVSQSIKTFTTKAYEKDLELIALVNNDVPRFLVADKNRVMQILLNLLGNAMKFTDTGYVVLRVACERNDSGIVLYIEVEDSGIGLSLEAQDKIFNSFTQAQKTTHQQYGGSGLGLSICRKLCELMGGSIRVESQEGEGSSFHCKLCLQAADQENEATDTAKDVTEITKVCIWSPLSFQQQISEIIQAAGYQVDLFDNAIEDMQDADFIIYDGAEKSSDSLQKLKSGISENCQLINIDYFGRSADVSLVKPWSTPELLIKLENKEDAQLIDRFESQTQYDSSTRILVVEDNQVNAMLIVKMLSQFGIDADVAENGEQALAKAEQEQYQLIFMDYELPDINGFEVTRKIRTSQGNNSHSHIVALSAHITESYKQQAKAFGLSDFVEKPLRLSNLERILRTYL